MARGALIGESMRVGTTLQVPRMAITRVVRCASGDEAAGQPRLWTFIEFELPDADAPSLAAALVDILEPEGGWYCDFHSADESFVVFAGRVFRYPRGDAAGRAQAAEHARSVGVPDHQLDWPEEPGSS